MAVLDEAGISDNCLTKRAIPPSASPLSSIVRDKLTRVAVPDDLQFVGCRYYLSKWYENFFTSSSQYCTWKWDGDIKIKNQTSYVRDTECDKIIKDIPGGESAKLKQAVRILQDYAEGSTFWHPCRTYRGLVSDIIKMYGNGQINSVNDMLVKLRNAVKQYHQTYGDVPYINGSLHKKMRYIEFVLSDCDHDVKLTVCSRK